MASYNFLYYLVWAYRSIKFGLAYSTCREFILRFKSKKALRNSIERSVEHRKGPCIL